MIGLSVSKLLALVLAVLVAVGSLFAGVWSYGESRYHAGEGAVRQEFAAALAKKNLDIGAYSSADDALAAVAETALAEHIKAAKLVAGNYPATAEQAAALSRIK